MSLSRYWPKRDEINRCIKAEAESASDAVLLAVHQPMALLRRDEGSGVESQVSEHELLETFLSDNLPQGTLLLPITGPSGAGKSHLIRWLAAQLGRDPRARNMHVIRIPKSASLRGVVDLVLEPLSGDVHFSNIRANLDNAITRVTPFQAAVNFSSALEIALADLAESLHIELRNTTDTTKQRDLMTRIYHAQSLAGFFNDAHLRDHMTSNVLAPIVQRAVAGRAGNQPIEEELLPQFSADDLRIPNNLRGPLGNAARSVQNYYHSGLSRDDGAGFKVAAQVLNEVVDKAIQKVFQLDQATGGITLESIILQIRELLLEQGRELVLLVEDFAALTGIQQVLLDVCIQEAERDGRQVRSRMRTALALTDGYLVGRDTITSRAKRVWVIQPNINADNVFARTVALTGAYLNAARWGEDALRAQYKQSAHDTEADLTSWITTFQHDDMTPEATDQLKAFGNSDTGIPLFPYNRLAIIELAKRHLRTGGGINFNPRRIINFILRDILLDGADYFEQGEFPPVGFEGATASASLAAWLATEPLSAAHRQRLEAILFYWGGDPDDPVQAAKIPSEIFDAFGLKQPDTLGNADTHPGPTTDPTVQPPPRPDPAPAPQQPVPTPELDRWRDKLRNWTRGTELAQQDAQRLRRILLKFVEKAIPWNRLRLAKRNPGLLLTIPNARGNEAPAAIRIAIADSHEDPHGQLQLALLGAIRLDEANGQLNYPEADEDSARIATLVEHLVQDLIPHLEKQREQEVRVLSWILLRQGRILGLLPRTRPKFDATVRALRNQSSTENHEHATEESPWQNLRHKASYLRPSLQQALWERTGCFQGTGSTVFALDPTLLDFAGDPQSFDVSFLDLEQRDHLTQLKPIRLTPATRPLVKKLKELSRQLDELLGTERDKQALLSALSGLFETLEPVGVWPVEFDRATMRSDSEAFRQMDLMAQLQEAGPLLDEGTETDLTADTTLERLGRLDLTVIEAAGRFLSRLELFIKAAERAMSTKEGTLSGIEPENDAKALEHMLQQLDRDLHTVIGDATK